MSGLEEGLLVKINKPHEVIISQKNVNINIYINEGRFYDAGDKI